MLKRAQVSIIIPARDEEKSIEPLVSEIQTVFKKIKKSYEIIFIDDGSKDATLAKISKLQKKNETIKILHLRAGFGKSFALDKGFKQAAGDIIVTLDADLQDNPKEIPKFLAKIWEGYDFVSGWRKNRKDNLIKKISSNLFNLGTSFISGVHLHDFNCGFKVFTKEVADELNLRGELHRFIPVLAYKNKFKVTEVIVRHRPRKFGQSKYGKLGITRSWKGILDLITAIFITDYSSKPAHFFGSIGIIFIIGGVTMDGYVTFIKMTTGTTGGKIPLLIAGVLFILLGVQLISTGLIAEMIVSLNQRNKNAS